MNTYAVIGGTLWGNRGAEAMVVTTIGRVRDRDPDARFIVMSYMAERDRELVTDPAVAVLDAGPKVSVLVHLPFAMLCWLLSLLRIRWPDVLLPRSVRLLRGCRALFDVSGISFHDGRLAVVAYNVVCLWPAMLLRVPVIRLSQAMGPFEQALNRVPARQMLRRATYTFARGRRTAEYLRDLDSSAERWSVSADVAFAYRDGDSLTRENEELVEQVATHLAQVRDRGQQIVALVPSSLVLKKMQARDEDYLAILRSVINHLHERHRHVVLVPNATRAGVDTMRNNDVAVIERLRASIESDAEGIDHEGLTYVDFDLNTAGIRALIADCELVITSRFHAMVASLSLGVPTLVMGWSHKYEEVLEMFGCEADAIDFTEADGALHAMIDRLIDDNADVRRRIAAALPDVVGSAQRQFDLLDALPNSSGRRPTSRRRPTT